MASASAAPSSEFGSWPQSDPQVNEAAEIIYEMVDPNANLIFGAVLDNSMPEDAVSITIIATGFGQMEPELGALNRCVRGGSRASAAHAAAKQWDARQQGTVLVQDLQRHLQHV